MAVSRGQKLTRLTLTELEKIAQERDHLLLNDPCSKKDPLHVPKQNRALFHCNKCGYEWSTKVYVYLERTSLSLGCRQCYETNVKDPNLYPNSPLRKKEINLARPTRRAGKEFLNAAFVNGPFGYINNVKDLINYLTSNSNAYNDKVLTLVLRNEDLKKDKVKTKDFFKDNVSHHHVIPLHSSGSPAHWNIIPVTKEEHNELHALRYEVYHEKGDLLATYGTQSDIYKAQTGGFKKIKQPKPDNSGIRNLRLPFGQTKG